MAAGTDLRLDRELIRLGASPADKAAAIREAGQLLVASGAVDPAYVSSMLRRERVSETYLGHGVAIPHGLGEDRHFVRRDGVAVLQVPAGVDWNVGSPVRLVVAIAARRDPHIAILRRLSGIVENEALLRRLVRTKDPALVAAALAPLVVSAASPDDEPGDAGSPPADGHGDDGRHFEWTLDDPDGLHARPASAWVNAARRLRSPLRIRLGDRVADARQLLSVLRLGARRGDRLVVSAEGEGAADALARFGDEIATLSAAAPHAASRAAAGAARAVPFAAGGPGGGTSRLAITGAAASPGLAIAPAHRVPDRAPAIADEPLALEQGARVLDEAIAVTRFRLAAVQDDVARRIGAEDAAIFAAQAALLDDTDLVTLACRLMVEGHGVAWSWREAIERTAGGMAADPDAVVRARAADLRDAGRRVLDVLSPSVATRLANPPARAVLVARDLSPSDTVDLDPALVAAIATAEGGPTSHAAILARTLGIPAVVACGDSLLEAAADGTAVIVDGDGGVLHVAPDDALARRAAVAIAAAARRRAADTEHHARPAETEDGHRIAIAANINTPDQADFAIGLGAEGVGLMRTEFLFLERGDNPTEAEQEAVFAAMADRLGRDPAGRARPLTVRALDIGGDKPVAHLAMPLEPNPFLGVRGLRLLLRRPDLLEPQLAALYRAARTREGQISLMFPMATSVPEVLRLREICERIRRAVDGPVVPIGIMIEVPAAAVTSLALARHVDFFSVGTNDLTQYTLAMDRRNAVLATEADSLHPAVLRLIRMTVDGARAYDRPVGVCGGLAGDPYGAAILVGLGIHELSMTPRDIPAVKARLRASRLSDLRILAERAVACDTAADVRALESGMLGAPPGAV